MRLRLLVLLLALTVPAGSLLASEPTDRSTATASASRGPLPLRSQNPLFRLFFRFAPIAARVPAAGDGTISLTSAYSSFFLADQSNDETNIALLDGELWRNTLQATVGLGHRLALSTEVPTLYGGGGFLDHLIEEYHDIFGFRQGGRDENPNDEFLFGLARDGQIAFLLPENELELGDVALVLDWLARAETDRHPAVLLRAGVEFPTGDEDTSFGNGTTDFGVGAAFEKGIGEYRLYGGMGYQLLGTPMRFETAGVRVRDTWSADLTAERPIGRSAFLLVQLGFEQSPVHSLSLPNVDHDSWTLAVSIAWRVSARWMLDFSFQEDLDSKSSQDLTGHFGLNWSF